MKKWSVLHFLLLQSCILVCVSRRIDLENNSRYDFGAPQEQNVDPASTYNNGDFSLILSPCKPESDGYFGATSGFPATIDYGFRLEILPLAQTDRILKAVEQKIADIALSRTFPEVCGYRRRELTASGFWFGKIEAIEDKCKPEKSPVNICGLFKGSVKVFGKSVDIDTISMTLGYISEILNTVEPYNIIHEDIVVISSVGSLTSVEGVANEAESRMSMIGKVGISLTVLAIIFCLLWYFCLRKGNVKDEESIALFSSTSSLTSRENWVQTKSKIEVGRDPTMPCRGSRQEVHRDSELYLQDVIPEETLGEPWNDEVGKGDLDATCEDSEESHSTFGIDRGHLDGDQLLVDNHSGSQVV